MEPTARKARDARIEKENAKAERDFENKIKIPKKISDKKYLLNLCNIKH